MSDRKEPDEFFDDVPEVLPSERSPAAALAQIPIETHLDLPTDGSPLHGLYMTHTASRLYGTATTVKVIKQVGLQWETKFPGSAIGIGDISQKGGGPISGHASHRKGIDFDVRLMRKDDARKYVTIHDPEYSREHTKALIDFFVANGIAKVTHVFFNDPALQHPPVQKWPHHDNHFHVRLEAK